MEDTIKSLYENINFIGFYTTYHKSSGYIQKIKDLMPNIQQFVEWFLSGDGFGLEEDLYVAMQRNLLEVLRDVNTALKENDNVLMMDALEQGLTAYLEMFLPEDTKEEGMGDDRSIEK